MTRARTADRFLRGVLSALLALMLVPGAVVVPEPAAAAVTTASLRCLEFVDANIGYAAGTGGTIIKTTDGGVSWSVQRSGDLLDLRSIDFVSATHGWAVSLDGVVLGTTDGGTTWAVLSNDLAGPFFVVEEFYDVEFFNTVEGITVGTAQDLPPQIFKTFNGGSGMWPFVTSCGTYDPPPEMNPEPKLGLGEFYAVDFPVAGRGWAVGHDRYKGANKPVVWDYDATRTGTYWRAQTITGTGPLYDVDFQSTTLGIAVGSGGRTYRTVNSGATWTQVAVGQTVDLKDVAWGTTGTAWTVGASGRIFRTTDSGVSWTAQTSPTAFALEDVAWLGGTTAVAVGASGTIVRTTDGSTWQVPTEPAGPQVTSVSSATHPLDVWVASTAVSAQWTATGTNLTGYGVVFDQVSTTVPSVVTTTATSGAFTATGSGTWWLHVAARDSLGRWSTTWHRKVLVDVTKPTAEFVPNPGGYAEVADVPLTAADEHSGVASVSYSVDGGSFVHATGASTTVSVSGVGTYDVAYYATDVAGNVSATQHATVEVRPGPQVTSVSSATHPLDVWVASTAVSAQWTATGTNLTGYGVVFDQVSTTVPSVVTTTATSGAFTATGSGTWWLHVAARDSLARWSNTWHRKVLVDVTKPVAQFAPNPAGYSETANVLLSATDAHSGVASVSYSVDGAPFVHATGSSVTVSISSVGTHSVAYYATDAAGNVSATGNATVEVRAASGPPAADPVDGPDRYSTAIEAAKTTFGSGSMPAGPDGHRWVVIASGRNWPDALAASGLAGALEAPLLLTEPDALPSTVSAYIDALGADRAAVVGGTAAVSQTVRNQLAVLVGSSANVKGYGAANRYATAELVASVAVNATGRPAWDKVAFMATGGNYPDALAAAPLAAALGRPLYLADPASGVSASTIASMKSAGVKQVIVLGGTAVVSQASVDRIKSAGITVGTSDRWSGANRYDTARVVAERSIASGALSAGATGLATGEGFADALAGGVAQGHEGGVLVLTESAALNPYARTFLTDRRASIDTLRFFGGTGALSAAVRSAALSAATVP